MYSIDSSILNVEYMKTVILNLKLALGLLIYSTTYNIKILIWIFTMPQEPLLECKTHIKHPKLQALYNRNNMSRISPQHNVRSITENYSTAQLKVPNCNVTKLSPPRKNHNPLILNENTIIKATFHLSNSHHQHVTCYVRLTLISFFVT